MGADSQSSWVFSFLESGSVPETLSSFTYRDGFEAGSVNVTGFHCAPHRVRTLFVQTKSLRNYSDVSAYLFRRRDSNSAENEDGSADGGSTLGCSWAEAGSA